MKLTYAELETELIKTKKALRETANGQPSEWAYVQLKAVADKLAEALEFNFKVDCTFCSNPSKNPDHVHAYVSPEVEYNIIKALKEYRGEK